MVGHRLGKAAVAGSNPARGSKKHYPQILSNSHYPNNSVCLYIDLQFMRIHGPAKMLVA